MLNNKPIDRSFEKFAGGPTPDRGQIIRITLNRQGHIYFNAKAYEMLGKPPSVYLYYSREKDQILIERTEWRHTISFPVRPKFSGWVVHAAPFCQNYRIKFPGTKRFVDPKFEDGRVYLALRAMVVVDGAKRPRKKQN